MKILFFGIALALSCSARAGPDQASRYYENALQRIEKRDLPGAVIQLKNAIKEDGRMLSAHLLLGKTLLRSGQVKAAQAALEETLSLGVDRGEVAVPLGQIYLLLDEPRLFLDRFAPPESPPALKAEVLALRGTAYAAIGDKGLATRSFEDARAADPKSAAPYVAEIPLAVAAGDLRRAASLADKAIELEPNGALAWSMKGSVLHARNESREALAAYERALANEPRYAEARVAHAGLLIEQNRYADAEKDLEFLAAERLDDARATYLRALVAGSKGDAPGVKAALVKAAQMIDALPAKWVATQEHLVMVGALSHYGLRNLEKARGYLEALIARSSRNLAPQKLLASIYVELRQFDRALPMLESLRKSGPEDPQVLFLLGSAYLAQGQFARAAEFLELAAARGGNAATIHALGLSQLALGRDELGFASLEKAYAANPGDVVAGMELAMTYSRRGQSKKALQIAEAMAKRDSANLALINFLGTVKTTSGDLPGARIAFEKSLQTDPRFRPAVLNLARLEATQGRVDAARTRLNTWLAAQAQDTDALYELGAVESRAGKPAEAIAVWRKAYALQSRDMRIALTLIDILADQGQFDAALTTAKELVAKFPREASPLLALGQVHLSKGDVGSARSTFESASRIPGLNPGTIVQIGRAQLTAGNFAAAVLDAQKALESQNGHLPALTLLVETEARRGDMGRAEAALKEMVKASPKGVATLLTRANLAMARGRHAEALADYLEAFSREPNTPTMINVVQAYGALGQPAKAEPFIGQWLKKRPQDPATLLALGEVQTANGKLEAARSTYGQALALQPSNALILNNMAVVLQKLNDPAAEVMANKALALKPGNPDIADTLGWILVQRGELATGLRHLREARLRRPESGDIRFHLAYALFKSGRASEAREELAPALKGPDGPRIASEAKLLKAELGL